MIECPSCHFGVLEYAGKRESGRDILPPPPGTNWAPLPRTFYEDYWKCSSCYNTYCEHNLPIGISSWSLPRFSFAAAIDGSVYIGDKKVGRVDQNGDIYAGDKKVGSVHRNGDIYAGDKKVGSVHYWDSGIYADGKKVGSIHLGGDICAGDKKVGRVAEAPSMLAGGAALVLTILGIRSWIKSQRYKCKTVEVAQALEAVRTAVVASGIASQRIYGLEVIRAAQELCTEGEGNSTSTAIEAAKARVPQDAFDVRTAQIVQQSQEETVEIQALSETQARQRAGTQAPQGAKIEIVNCIIEPKGGFLGIGKKEGFWKVRWSKPFRARISYKSPAVAVVWYME